MIRGSTISGQCKCRDCLRLGAVYKMSNNSKKPFDQEARAKSLALESVGTFNVGEAFLGMVQGGGNRVSKNTIDHAPH